MNQIIFNQSERMTTSMNKTSLKLYAALILILNLMPCRINAQNDYADFFKYSYTIIRENPLNRAFQNVVFSLAYISLFPAYEYMTVDALQSEKYLVKKDYPLAQAWINEIGKKYPELHFENKLFLQHNKSSALGYIPHNHIYFYRETLEALESCYRKKMKKAQLHVQEEQLLAQEELYLVRQAGCIERNDIQDLYIAAAGLSVSEALLAYGLNNIVQDKNTSYDTAAARDAAFTKYNFNSRCICLVTGAAALASFYYFIIDQEKKADDIALNLMQQKNKEASL
jgi:hypothetical protein